MALEQTINLNSKTRGGIIGITQKESALERWFLTSHERASITSATKGLCYLDDTDKVGTHKEAGSRRQQRDEADVRKVLNTIIAEDMKAVNGYQTNFRKSFTNFTCKNFCNIFLIYSIYIVRVFG